MPPSSKPIASGSYRENNSIALRMQRAPKRIHHTCDYRYFSFIFVSPLLNLLQFDVCAFYYFAVNVLSERVNVWSPEPFVDFSLFRSFHFLFNFISSSSSFFILRMKWQTINSAILSNG